MREDAGVESDSATDTLGCDVVLSLPLSLPLSSLSLALSHLSRISLTHPLISLSASLISLSLSLSLSLYRSLSLSLLFIVELHGYALQKPLSERMGPKAEQSGPSPLPRHPSRRPGRSPGRRGPRRPASTRTDAAWLRSSQQQAGARFHPDSPTARHGESRRLRCPPHHGLRPKSCRVNAPGAGPGQWGSSHALRSGDGAGLSGQGQPHTRDPDQLPSNSPIGIAPFGSVSYTISTTLARA